jgi:hypothetical protein
MTISGVAALFAAMNTPVVPGSVPPSAVAAPPAEFDE